MKRFTLFLSIVFISISLFAQKDFVGEIEFGVEVTGEGAEQMAAFMPTSYKYFIDGDNILFKMEGGLTAAMMGDIVVNNKTGESYMIKHAEKTAYKIEADEETAEEASKDIKTSKMDEVLEIEGYKCRKYKVTSADGTTQYVWATSEISLKKPKSSVKNKMGGGLFVDGIEGFPLKVMTSIPGTGMSMVMTAEHVKKKKLDGDMFLVPKDYEVKDFDPSSLGF